VRPNLVLGESCGGSPPQTALDLLQERERLHLCPELACQIGGGDNALERAVVVFDEDVAKRADFADETEEFFMSSDGSDFYQRFGHRSVGVAKERLRDRFPGHAAAEVPIVVDHGELADPALERESSRWSRTSTNGGRWEARRWQVSIAPRRSPKPSTAWASKSCRCFNFSGNSLKNADDNMLRVGGEAVVGVYADYFLKLWRNARG
jgi:hypothetical protein